MAILNSRHDLRYIIMGVLMLLTSLLSACSSDSTPALLQNLDTKQLVLVVSDDWSATTATLQKFEWINDKWQKVDEAFPVNLGRKGMSWGLGIHPTQTGNYKVEGDGTATAGIFDLSSTFGYLPEANTNMPYQPMSGDNYCMDVNASPLYNQIVDKSVVGEDAVKDSTEPMRRDIHKDGQTIYKKGIVINHNPDNISGKGSCIFAHLWFGPEVPTAGCTSMEESKMDTLLAWLKPEKNPRYVALPKNEYKKKMKVWGLPAL